MTYCSPIEFNDYYLLRLLFPLTFSQLDDVLAIHDFPYN